MLIIQALFSQESPDSGAGCGENHAHPDTSMKLCPNMHYYELFENFSLANPNYLWFQNGSQDGYQNSLKCAKWRYNMLKRYKMIARMEYMDQNLRTLFIFRFFTNENFAPFGVT